MNKFMKRLVVLSVMFLGLCSSIYACPAGMVELPGGVCLPPDHQNSPLNNLPSASPPPPVWADRWGAIATDGPTASLGAVVDMRSKRQAEKAALTECRAKGGKKCEVDLAYYNQCAVMVTGDNSYLSQGAVSKEEATRIAMQKCQAKDVNCRVYYSGCSMPVRVN